MPISKSDPRPCAVYRWFARGGRLLYVGASLDPDKRWGELSWQFEWPGLLAEQREVLWFHSCGAALEAERAAIKTEDPLFNITPRRGRTMRGVVVRWITLPGEEPTPCLYDGPDWLIGSRRIQERTVWWERTRGKACALRASHEVLSGELRPSETPRVYVSLTEGLVESHDLCDSATTGSSPWN